MPRTLQGFTVPRGKRDLLEAIETNNVIRKIRMMPNGGVVSREILCRLIRIDPAPLSSPDPILRDAFVQWFHRYLQVLRRAIVDANIPTMLEYPDHENEANEPTGAGRGIALLKMDGASAGAFLLLKCSREGAALVKRYGSRMRVMLAEDSQFMPGARRQRDALRGMINGMLQVSKGNLEITQQITAAALRELPSLDAYFNTVLDTVIFPEEPNV